MVFGRSWRLADKDNAMIWDKIRKLEKENAELRKQRDSDMSQLRSKFSEIEGRMTDDSEEYHDRD